MFTYEHPRPSLTVDCVVFGFDAAREADLKVLLIQRAIEPFRNWWALPGGFVRAGESLESAARRELKEETGLTDLYLEQLYSFGEPDRDPRGWTISVAYYALVALAGRPLTATADASSVAWFSVAELPSLAFDHREIVTLAVKRLQAKVRYQPVGFELLPEKFTLSQLQHLYESVLERQLDKRNFRKKILAMDVLKETDEIEQDVAHRAARLYRFDEGKYQKHVKRGFNFEL